MVTDAPVLEMRGVRAGYGDTTILHGVDLRVEPGSVLALLGRNGMGKSTTISTIAGLVPTWSGRVSLSGQELGHTDAIRRGRLGVGLVPEDRRVFGSCTVKEHLTMGARPARNGAEPWDLGRLYRTFPVLENRASARGTELSGGERQLLAIARALSSNPTLLLLDEPSEGLAPSVVAEVAETVKQIAAENQHGGILLVEQNVRLALSVADRVAVMARGAVVFDGTRAEFEARPEVQDKYIGIA